MGTISAVYKIQSIIKPERIYIGSAVNIHARWIRHCWELKAGVHSCSKLQRHYNKYGKNDIVFSILIGCIKEDLITTEQFYLDSHVTYFNTCKIAGSVLGIKRSKETKSKISIANKGRQTALGRKVSDETKRKISLKLMGHKNNVGYKCSEETKLKISIANKGKPRRSGWHHTEEVKNKIRNLLKGKKTGITPSEETRKKMSESLKGRNPHEWTDEGRDKLRQFHLGAKLSQSTRQKMRVSQKLRRESEMALKQVNMN
jgi:group I intron endonuclease